jgi:hypothetical protein
MVYHLHHRGMAASSAVSFVHIILAFEPLPSGIALAYHLAFTAALTRPLGSTDWDLGVSPFFKSN